MTVTITNPRDRVTQAIFLKGHARLYGLGMKHSQITGSQVLAKCEAVTGKKYKRGQYDLAVQDLQAIIDEAKKAT